MRNGLMVGAPFPPVHHPNQVITLDLGSCSAESCSSVLGCKTAAASLGQLGKHEQLFMFTHRLKKELEGIARKSRVYQVVVDPAPPLALEAYPHGPMKKGSYLEGAFGNNNTHPRLYARGDACIRRAHEA